MTDLAWATRSDVGHRRKVNEDAVIAEPPIFAVADGMGGHAAGDVASAMAAQGLGQLTGHGAITRREVIEAIRRADERISRRGADRATAGMGTTITGLAVTRAENGAESIVVFNVGDSRTYLFRDGALGRISHDHSVVQELVDSGLLLPGEVETHPERNVVTRSLGAGSPLDIDWWVLTPETGDRFLVCSDGLCKEIPDPVILELIAAQGDLEVAASALLDAALDAGGNDNVSLVLIDVLATDHAPVLEGPDDDTHPRGLVTGGDSDDTNPFGVRQVPGAVEPSSPSNDSFPDASSGPLADVPLVGPAAEPTIGEQTP